MICIALAVVSLTSMILIFLRLSDVVAAKILEVLEALLAVLSMLLMLLRIHPVVMNEVQDVSGRGRGENRRLRMVVVWMHCRLEVGIYVLEYISFNSIYTG